MALTWNDSYKLGFKEIDEQHQKFAMILNKLIGIVDQPDNKIELEKIFTEISDYADYHFTTEEKYFDQFHYKDAEEHKQKHREFKQKIGEIKNKYLTNQVEATFDLADFLEDWLIDHLDQMDKKYVDCFREHGLK